METEEWRAVKGFENRYEVSSLGRVRSLNYRMRKGCIRVLKPAMNSDGYLNVHLYALDGGGTYKIHRLVAEAFLPNPGGLPEVNHKNENKSDNRVMNLEWCDRDYNIHYGTISKRIVAKQSKAVMAVDPETGCVVYTFPSAEAAKVKGFVPSEISRCCRRVNNRKFHSGLLWMYAIESEKSV
ncbi:MAG: NUMOD4 motif-containing HNH endonuclease [Oscillibacter sp.]|nr:NUMOD4 motif-containing HNH endonuclease [Oscillibacter sp.]